MDEDVAKAGGSGKARGERFRYQALTARHLKSLAVCPGDAASLGENLGRNIDSYLYEQLQQALQLVWIVADFGGRAAAVAFESVEIGP